MQKTIEKLYYNANVSQYKIKAYLGIRGLLLIIPSLSTNQFIQFQFPGGGGGSAG